MTSKKKAKKVGKDSSEQKWNRAVEGKKRNKVEKKKGENVKEVLRMN